ncbi:hypothetical protein R5W23_001870 [Gemmata sp. JC673]|uniref:Uncharacterized protein n=1 Tax=Gemmata algarum TaxID=2975278 RepID=A0ABU5F1L0_9BACT|nr:hypothetical protein [Gemmata algarum]MDY3560625.1 hypothetical protein [Gemmata algarum]
MREFASLLAMLSLIALLAAVCVVAPAVVAVLVNPWAGLPVAVGSFWVWGRFGPPPMPGFLSVILCLWGHAAILGSLVACVLLAVRR